VFTGEIQETSNEKRGISCVFSMRTRASYNNFLKGKSAPGERGFLDDSIIREVHRGWELYYDELFRIVWVRHIGSDVSGEDSDSRMRRTMRTRGRIFMGVVIILAVLIWTFGIALSENRVHIGVVVGLEPKIVRARGEDGTVSVFWVGRKTHWKSGRIPHIGERVRIKYVKDRLYRNAVMELTILEK
jgi:hypothetical protein